MSPPHAATRRVWRAPGRVNLIGDHTDYQEGYCLPMAVDRECRIEIAARDDARVRARSAQLAGVVDIPADGSVDPMTVEPPWGRFVASVVATLAARGARTSGYEIAVASNVPAGSGLSSSSALTVALTVALAELGGLALPRDTLAHLALEAEVRATGVPGGLMDQLAAVHAVPGHALLLDCRSLAVDAIPLPRALGVVVVHSGQPRTLADSAYADRRAECEAVAARLGVRTLRDATPDQVREHPLARHVVSENARVLDFAAALRTGDLDELGRLMLASHASLRDDFEVSTPELDRAVGWLVQSGALGARLTGAGFGGCVVGIVQRNHADDLLARVSRMARTQTGIEPLAFAVRPGDPAGEVREAPRPVR